MIHKSIHICFLLGLLDMDISTASHTVKNQYSGTIFVELKNNALKDSSNNAIYCDIIGDSAVTFTWKWRGSYTERMDDIFEWTLDSKVINGNTETGSFLRWRNDVLDSVKRDITNRTVFAEGAHQGDTNVKIPCDNTTIIITWTPVKPTVKISQNPIVNGSTVDIRCEVTYQGNPPGEVTWIGDHITGGVSESIIFEVTKAHHQSTWACYYTNMAGKGGTSDNVTLDVHWPPGQSSLTIDYDGEYIRRGDQLRLTCNCNDAGNPLGHVVWKVGDANTTHTSDIVEITSDNENDYNGDWKCYYENNIDKGKASITRNVDVKWAASGVDLSILNTTDQFDEGDSLFLKCIYRDPGNPGASDVTFKLNGVSFTNIININSTTHRIKSISRSTNGSLQCCYGNIAGINCSGSKFIHVRWAVSTYPFIQHNDPNNDVREGDDIYLECFLNDTGSPPAVFTWTHNDTVKNVGNNNTLKLSNIMFSDSGVYGCYANNSLSISDVATYTIIVKPRQAFLEIWVFIVIGLGCCILLIVIIVIIICCVKKKKRNDKKSDAIGYANRSLQPDNMTGTGPANKPNIEAAAPVYAAVSKGKVLAPIVAGADESVYSQVDLSKKTSRQSLKGLPMSKKATDRIIFHKKDGYVNMTFQVRKKFKGDIEIGVCRVGDQSCTSKVSKQHDGTSKDVVMVLPIEDSSPDSYSIHMKFTERGQVTQTVDLTYPYNKNAVNVTVLNNVYGSNGSEMPENSEVNKPMKKKKASQNDRPTNVVSPSYADVEVEGVPPRPSRQGYPAEGVTYAVMDWDRSQAPGRPPRLSSRSPAQEHVVYADVRPGGNVY